MAELERLTVETIGLKTVDPERADVEDTKNRQDADDTGKETNLNKATEERGTWGHRAEFVLSLLGFSVGLSNFWRFPYLCYRNGGGAFLIPYWIFMFLCAVPVFYMELAIGQFCSASAVSVWSICPALKGAGVAAAAISMVCNIYYMVLLAYVAFYFVESFTLGPLPWSSCSHSWNTANCLDYSNTTLMALYAAHKHNNLTDTYNSTTNGLFGNMTMKSPADEYFNHRLLQVSSGLTEPGSVVWQLLLCFIPVWIIVFLCLIRGVKSVGKAVYFTATFPYVLLTILLIRGLTLPGAMDGVAWYITPNFTKLMEAQVWCDGAFQVYYSLGPGWGSVITMGSFNNFRTKFDGVMIPIAMGLTSVYAGFVVFSAAGFMAKAIGRPINELVDKGPGLAFIMYPEVIAQLPLPSLWSILFFTMLFMLGLDSQFVSAETAVMSVWDDLPPKLRISRFKLLVIGSIFMFLCGIPCITQGGIYLIQIIDNYSSTYTCFLVCICEIIGIAWIYGAERFVDDICFMTGSRMHGKFWKPVWRFVTLGLLLTMLVVAILQYRPLTTYGTYTFPPWTVGLGWGLALTSLIWIPLVFIKAVFQAPGQNIFQKVVRSFQPTSAWGPANEEDRREWLEFRNASKQQISFVKRITHFFQQKQND